MGVWAGMGPFWRPKEILEETKEPEYSIRKTQVLVQQPKLVAHPHFAGEIVGVWATPWYTERSWEAWDSHWEPQRSVEIPGFSFGLGINSISREEDPLGLLMIHWRGSCHPMGSRRRFASKVVEFVELGGIPGFPSWHRFLTVFEGF